MLTSARSLLLTCAEVSLALPAPPAEQETGGRPVCCYVSSHRFVTRVCCHPFDASGAMYEDKRKSLMQLCESKNMAAGPQDLASGLLAAVVEIAGWLPAELPAGSDLPEVTASQLAALRYLAAHGTSEMHTLAAGAGVTAPTMTATIKVLARKGLVDREHDEQDWRKVLITATARGKAAYEEYLERRQRALTDALARLSDEHRALLLVSLPALRALAHAGAG
jgi:DNA-binding MarR family transcriptional regulator